MGTCDSAGANIVLIELTNGLKNADVSNAVNTAVSAGVGASVVSMSFGGGEFSGETSGSTTNEVDGLFNHPGVSFITSSGDNGLPTQFPSASPNVLSVGATNLNLNPDNSYLSEEAWSNPQLITNASESGNTVTITTATATGLSKGNIATITGTSVAGYEGNFPIDSILSDTQFTYTDPTGGLTTSTPTGISTATDSISAGVNTVTITTSAAHGLSTGDTVNISGVGVAGYNGVFKITGTPSANQFTYTIGSATALANSGGGTVSGIVFGSGFTGGNAGGSGGGRSQFEPQPGFQSSVPASISTVGGVANRTNPDVAFVGGTGTPVNEYDSFANGGPTVPTGGSSLSAPCWAGLVAIVDQGLALLGLPLFDTASTLQTALYGLPSTDFHDIVSGFNGASAGPGYDLATGLGSPVANLLVPDLVGQSMTGIGNHINLNEFSDKAPAIATANNQVYVAWRVR